MDFVKSYKIEQSFYNCNLIKYCSILNKWNLIITKNINLKHEIALKTEELENNYFVNNGSETLTDNEEQLETSMTKSETNCFSKEDEGDEMKKIDINSENNTLKANISNYNLGSEINSIKSKENDNNSNYNFRSLLNPVKSLSLENTLSKIDNDFFQRSKKFCKNDSSQDCGIKSNLAWRVKKEEINPEEGIKKNNKVFIESGNNSFKTISTKKGTLKTSSLYNESNCNVSNNDKDLLSIKPINKAKNSALELINNSKKNKYEENLLNNSSNNNIYNNYFFNSKSLNNSQRKDDYKSEENNSDLDLNEKKSSYILNNSIKEEVKKEKNIEDKNNDKKSKNIFENSNCLFFQKYPIFSINKVLNINRILNSSSNNDSFNHQPKLLHKTKNLKFLTYNVWFSQYNFKQRSEEIIKILQAKDPDFICLQEVTESFMDKLLDSSFIRSNFYISNVPCQLSSWYDVVILSKYCCNAYVVPFLSKMQRKLMYITLYNPENELLKIGTAHFESFNSKIYTRESQIKLSYNVLNNLEKDKELFSKPKHSFLLGDFNLSEKDNSIISESGYTDWGLEIINKIKIDEMKKLKSNSSYYFKNKEDLNTMKEMKGYPAWRPDRFTYKTSSKSFSINKFEILGKKDIINDYTNPVNTPSDHYAIYAECNL